MAIKRFEIASLSDAQLRKKVTEIANELNKATGAKLKLRGAGWDASKFAYVKRKEMRHQGGRDLVAKLWDQLEKMGFDDKEYATGAGPYTYFLSKKEGDVSIQVDVNSFSLEIRCVRPKGSVMAIKKMELSGPSSKVMKTWRCTIKTKDGMSSLSVDAYTADEAKEKARERAKRLAKGGGVGVTDVKELKGVK
jgi:hypothetical protein